MILKKSLRDTPCDLRFGTDNLKGNGANSLTVKAVNLKDKGQTI